MKEQRKRDAKGFYKELRKASPMPFLLAGVAFLAYGLLTSVYTVWDYALGAGIAVLAYTIGRGVWPGERVRIDLPPDTGDNQTDQLLTEARKTLSAIRASNDRIADEKVSACIEAIDRACGDILLRLEESPALYGQLRTFLRYYLPTTKKLLEARAAIEQDGMNTENARLVCGRTDRVLPEIRNAFDKQLEALDKNRYLDLQVEMDVLEGMLKSDGLETKRERERI